MNVVYALRSLLARVFAAMGLEGAFLIVGTTLMAIGASFLSPAGPFFVVGAVCILAGLAIALPQRPET